jgi:hypothetical protein
MNGPAYKNHLMKRMNRLMQSPFLFVLLSLVLVRVASATDALYQNNAVLNYTVPGSPPPVIDARAFDNENEFNVDFSVYSPNVLFYEPMNTLFYTNNGTMTVNSPILNSFFFFNSTFGCGFRFDQQTTNTLTPHLMADTFYNPGTIRCDSFLDGNNVFNFAGSQFFIFTSIGECIVSATNIINPGVVQLGVDGLMQFTGQNVDLTRSTLNMETLQNLFLGDSVGLNSYGAVGLDTNADWNPALDLGSTSAISSYSPFPNVLYLTNSTSYFDVQSSDPSNVVIRAVFVQNNSPGVPYNVYFDGNVGSPGFAIGAAHVEWIGSYVDPATGGTATKYLYLTDDYLLGASTNVFVNGGVPSNFSFLTSDTSLLAGPAAAGFLNVYTDGYITNRYSYMNAQLVPQTTATNASVTNPSGALTNLPGRVQITATKGLNLALAQISGQNYLSLTATNQFDGNEGAQILSPFSDINLGVTNGFLQVSNLLQSALPNWSGSVQAWSTRWVEVINGVTNDFRVMLVGSSDLIPLSAPYVQDLKLHATNSLIIADVMNVLRTLSIDTKRLTLTANGIGNGAGSAQGELNLLSGNILWPDSLPNLRWLTNNGAIRTLNSANFYGNDAIVTITPGTPLTAAAGTLSQLGGLNVAANDKVTIGTKQYTFVSSIARGASANQVKVGAAFDDSMNNLIAAINLASGAGTKYSSATTVNAQVNAGTLASHAFTVTAKIAGAAGNTNVTTTTSTHLTWSGHTNLFGGTDYVAATTNTSSVLAPYGTFINNGFLSDQGSTIYAGYFENGGIITNGVGSFILQAPVTVLTNGAIYAGGDVSIIADSLVISNLTLRASRSLFLQVTNLLTDSDATNLNYWSVGSATGNNGMKLPILPPVGDLRYTTITNTAPASKNVINVWAGQDRGVSTAGYTNNAAVGRLILNSLGLQPGSLLTFNGAGISNAIYVDDLEFINQATNRDASGNMKVLAINTNLVIYYAQAFLNGVPAADKLNHKNNDRLRWVPAYAGYFSSTNLVYGGVTNTVNAALAQSATIDSDQDSVANAFDATPFFGPTNVNLSITVTNAQVLLAWQTIPSATNIVYYKTNFAAPSWMVLTNFTTPPAPPYAPITEMLYDNPALMRIYQVGVFPNSLLFYGP